MAIWRDEVFGPVIALRVIDGYEAAVAAVNDSSYGLSAALVGLRFYTRTKTVAIRSAA